MSLFIALQPSSQPPPPPPIQAPGNANCYDLTSGDTVDVDTMAELGAAVNSAPGGGRQVRVAPGNYNGGGLTFSRRGNAPVVVRPRDARGTVTVTGADWEFSDASSRIVIAGLFFSDSKIKFSGDHNRITRCRWRGLNGKRSIKFFSSRDGRVDHCDFSDAKTGVKNNVISWEPDGFANGKNVRNRLDYCYFHDLKQTSASVGNGQELLSLWAQAKNMALSPAGSVAVVDHCLFVDCAYAGEGELISIKSGGWKLSFCTFERTGFYQQFRTSDNGEIRSCWFEKTKNPTFNIFGRNHLFIGNRVMDQMDVRVGCGNATSSQVIAGSVHIGAYARAENAQVIGNHMGTGYLVVGGFWSNNQKQEYPCLNANLYQNTRSGGGDAHKLIEGNHSGTTFRDPGDRYRYVPATKLTPADVGLAAADPLCPQGPQS